ncbi:MAG: hypothetical protein AB1481_05445 [Candidatus Omnitrophota bacterium]
MRSNTFLRLTGIVFLCAMIFLETASAAVISLQPQNQQYARRGSDHGDGHDDDDDRHHGGHHKHYRYYRYYPGDYYYYRKIYYPPYKKYYYYYDIYPEKLYYYESERAIPPYNPAYLPIMSIANMASQGVPDDVIIEEIKRTHSVYKLSSETITYLKQNNVSDRVIDFMIATGRS